MEQCSAPGTDSNMSKMSSCLEQDGEGFTIYARALESQACNILPLLLSCSVRMCEKTVTGIEKVLLATRKISISKRKKQLPPAAAGGAILSWRVSSCNVYFSSWWFFFFFLLCGNLTSHWFQSPLRLQVSVLSVLLRDLD